MSTQHRLGYRHFHDDLATLTRQLLDMAEQAESFVALAMEALLERDRGKADAVIAADAALDRLEVETEERAIAMLALQQPMARDLRFLIGAIKICNDIERVGDHAVNIAEVTVRLEERGAPHFVLPPLTDMALRARTMLSQALDAFIRGDGTLGRTVGKADDEVDAMHRNIHRQLSDLMMRDPQNVPVGLELLVVNRSLERIADLATNIGENAVYLAEGTQTRHRFDENPAPPDQP